MFNSLVPLAQLALTKAKREAVKQNLCFVEPEHLLLGLLDLPKGPAREFLAEHGLELESFRAKVRENSGPQSDEKVVGEPLFNSAAKSVMATAYGYAKEKGHKFVCDVHLLLGLAREKDSLAGKTLEEAGITSEDVESLLESHLGSGEKPEDGLGGRIRLEFIPFSLNNLNPQEKRYFEEMRRRGLGGPLPEAGSENMEIGGEEPGRVLEQFGVNLTELAKAGRFDPLVGRLKELERLAIILSRRQKNNPVLLGEAGVGKTAIVEGLAQRIVEGRVPKPLLGKKIFALDLSRLLAGTSYRGQFEEKVLKFLDALKKDANTIVFIDELHTLLGAGSVKESSNDAANMLKPALARGEINCIGATTLDEYRRTIEKDSALERRFQPIIVDQPSKEETLKILKGLKERYENFHHAAYPEETLEAMVNLSARYIQGRHFPDKAIDVMDEAGARAQLRRLEQQEEGPVTVTPHDVAVAVSSWAKVPADTVEEAERSRLMRMEKELHKTVIGQDEAIEALSRALRRSRANLRDPNRPIGSFLALGPTGVGKSLLAQALAKFLFDDPEALITVDMGEYAEKFNVSRLFGAPPGYVGHDDGGQLTERIRRRPFSVILFDEIEKAHPDVLHALLQVLENGRMTDSTGRTVDFRNTIIILTSNLGARELFENRSLGFGAGPSGDVSAIRKSLLEKAQKALRPEFVNRLDEMLVFLPLAKEELVKVVDLEVAKLSSRLETQGIKLKLTPAAKAKICELGDCARFGARQIRRTVEKELEDKLAEVLLAKVIPHGAIITVKAKEGEFVFETALLPEETPAQA